MTKIRENDVLQFFGFKVFPFSGLPHHHIFYPHDSHAAAYANILNGIKQRIGLILLTGAPGVGKTTVINKALHGFSEKTRPVFLRYGNFHFQELVDYVCRDLNVTQKRDSEPKTEAFSRYLIERHDQGETVVLIIDDINRLDNNLVTDLLALSDPRGVGENLFLLMLIGLPRLEEKLEPVNAGKIEMICRLTALSEKEVGDYIDNHLRAIGFEKQSPFSPEAVSRIAKISEGIPGKINLICSSAIVFASLEGRKVISPQLVDKAADQTLITNPNRQISAPPTPESVKDSEHSSVIHSILNAPHQHGDKKYEPQPEKTPAAHSSHAGIPHIHGDDCKHHVVHVRKPRESTNFQIFGQHWIIGSTLFLLTAVTVGYVRLQLNPDNTIQQGGNLEVFAAPAEYRSLPSPNTPPSSVNSDLRAQSAEKQPKSNETLTVNGTDTHPGPDRHGDTPLMSAAWSGSIDILQNLVVNDELVNKQNRQGRTALINAATHGHNTFVKALLAIGANPNLSDVSGNTALMMAATNGSRNIVQSLLDGNAVKNKYNRDGWTALMYAAWKGQKEVVRLLINRGADTALKNRDNLSAAELAATQGHWETVTLLKQAVTNDNDW